VRHTWLQGFSTSIRKRRYVLRHRRLVMERPFTLLFPRYTLASLFLSTSLFVGWEALPLEFIPPPGLKGGGRTCGAVQGMSTRCVGVDKVCGGSRRYVGVYKVYKVYKVCGGM
jgi:hypothetical protein